MPNDREPTDPRSYSAIATDFVVNQRLNLKMDLPTERETVMGMFDRVRRSFPAMNRFKRTQGTLALESDIASGTGSGEQLWMTLRKNSIRSGAANPSSTKSAYGLHALVLEVAPYFLGISPLDVDFVELLFGFDISCPANHDAVVFEALMAGSPMGKLMMPLSKNTPDAMSDAFPVDCQPLLGVSLDGAGELQAHFEVRTRTTPAPHRRGQFEPAPISINLILRKHGVISGIDELPAILRGMTGVGEELLDQRVIPHLLMPIREVVNSIGGSDEDQPPQD